MANVNDINCTIDGFESLIAAIVAENCTAMYLWGRKLVRKDYYDPSDPEARQVDEKGNKRISKKKCEANYNEYKDWLIDPRSDFNTYWKDMIALVKDGETRLNGKEIAAAIDMMIEDVDNYPEDERSFRQEKN